MLQSDIGFSFTGFILVIPILALIIYAIGKVRRADPSKRRRYAALGVIIVLIISVSTIIVLNLPPVRRIELDITLDFKSNSTDHEAMYQYHWDASGIRTDVFGRHINWIEQYGDVHSYGSGVLDELLRDRGVEGFDIQWTELELFANETWTLLMNFYVGMIFDGQLVLQGDNQSIHVDDYGTTDGQFSSNLLEGLDSLGIEGLEIYMDITLKIEASILRTCFREISIELQISDDIEMIVDDMAFGIIS
ncbi:MAG: hypothetical protein ACFFEV_03400 [Candidatus Thorarchaeota archaeon]